MSTAFVLKAPSNINQGEIYIDRIMFSIDDARYQWSDYQIKNTIIRAGN